ncbi:MAG: hypothetical protein ACKPCM_02455 [Pseudanabaena sp.]
MYGEIVPPKPRSPKSQNQTAIAFSTPTTPDRLLPQIKQRLPLITHKPDRLLPQHQTAIAPHHTQNPIASSSNKTAIAHISD